MTLELKGTYVLKFETEREGSIYVLVLDPIITHSSTIWYTELGKDKPFHYDVGGDNRAFDLYEQPKKNMVSSGYPFKLYPYK